MAYLVKIDGISSLQQFLKDYGKMPDKIISKSVQKASRIVLQSAKRNIPSDTGLMRQSLSARLEKKKRKAKRVSRIGFKAYLYDQIKAEHDQSNADRSNLPKKKRGKPFFYPSAVEFGYFTRSGRFIPGYHFLRNALENNKDLFERLLIKEIDQALKKLAGGG